MVNICTVSDVNYLTKGITLYESILKHNSNFVLHYLCIDNETYDKLLTIGFKNLKPYNINYLISLDDNLKILKDKNYKYFCWSLASYFSNYLLENNDFDITYIDSDIFFHQDIKILMDEIGDNQIGIFRHRQFPLNFNKPEGFYNVGVVHFKNKEYGKSVLKWWSDAVLHMKYPHLATCGDQKYLDEFPNMCPRDHIFIDGNIGHGAPWQWQLYDFANYEKNQTIIWEGNEQKLIFSHFSQFELLSDGYIPSKMHHIYTPLNNYVEIKGLKMIYDEYYNNLLITEYLRKKFIMDNNDMKIAFGMIVFEGDYVLKECLEQVYPFASQILIAEGPVSYWQRQGRTTSLDETNNILDNFPDPENKIKVVHGNFNEKDDQCRAYMKYINDDIDYIWNLDSDEVYKTEDLEEMINLLEKEQPTSVGVRSCSFYGGFDNYLTGFELKRDNFLRIFKYVKGCTWLTHRPPTIKYPTDLNIIRKHIDSETLYNERGIQMYHYSYVFPKQVHTKIGYYKDSVSKENWIDNYFNEVYLPWVLGDDNQKNNVENRFLGVHEFKPQVRGECYTDKFTSEHPESIQKNIHKLKDKFKNQLEEYKNGG